MFLYSAQERMRRHFFYSKLKKWKYLVSHFFPFDSVGKKKAFRLPRKNYNVTIMVTAIIIKIEKHDSITKATDLSK